MSKFICISTPIRDEAYCLRQYLANIIPLADGVVCILDDRTADDSENILIEHGVIYKTVTFTDFSQIGNIMLDVSADNGFEYAFVLNPDERIIPEVFYRLVSFVKDNPNADVIYMARHNWYDLDMNKEREDVFPDMQPKILKLSNKKLRYVGKVHETITGTGKVIAAPFDICTHHFNLYYYKTGDQNYEKKIEQYNRLNGG